MFLFYYNESLWDSVIKIYAILFSAIIFATITLSFLLYIFVHWQNWRIGKLVSFIITLLINSLIAVGFHWIIAVPAIVCVSCFGIWVLNRIDFPIAYKQAMHGGNHIFEYKRLQQIEIFNEMPIEDQMQYQLTVPPLKLMKVRPWFFFIITAIPGICLSVIEIFWFHYWGLFISSPL